MPIDRTAFQEITPGNFKTRFTTEDGHQFDVTIYSDTSSQGKDAVDFACGYLSQEMKIRRRAAKLIFARYDEIKDELGYTTDEDLFKALEPGELVINWSQWQETFMAYLSPLDDLELWGDKHVILVRYDGNTEDPEVYLEQTS